jgi:hypothetical protein
MLTNNSQVYIVAVRSQSGLIFLILFCVLALLVSNQHLSLLSPLQNGLTSFGRPESRVAGSTYSAPLIAGCLPNLNMFGEKGKPVLTMKLN